MESIVRVSEVSKDNEKKYGKYARYKVIVDFLKDNKLFKREDFLDEKQAEVDINNYISRLKIKRDEIHFKSLKQRIIYNLIMGGIGVASIFLILGICNLLINVGINSILMGIIGNIVIPITITGEFIYVNQKKFYYSKNEINLLDEIKNEITRCDGILADIYKMKMEGNTFEYDYQRLNKDYENVRDRNRERNIKMQLNTIKERREVDKRINEGVNRQIKEMSKNRHQVNNVDFDYFENNKKKSLQRNSSFREIKDDVKDLMEERKEIREQERYPDNSFQRGERRGR